jgi:hypothetical protein
MVPAPVSMPTRCSPHSEQSDADRVTGGGGGGLDIHESLFFPTSQPNRSVRLTPSRIQDWIAELSVRLERLVAAMGTRTT